MFRFQLKSIFSFALPWASLLSMMLVFFYWTPMCQTQQRDLAPTASLPVFYQFLDSVLLNPIEMAFSLDAMTDEHALIWNLKKLNTFFISPLPRLQALYEILELEGEEEIPGQNLSNPPPTAYPFYNFCTETIYSCRNQYMNTIKKQLNKVSKGSSPSKQGEEGKKSSSSWMLQSPIEANYRCREDFEKCLNLATPYLPMLSAKVASKLNIPDTHTHAHGQTQVYAYAHPAPVIGFQKLLFSELLIMYLMEEVRKTFLVSADDRDFNIPNELIMPTLKSFRIPKHWSRIMNPIQS
ncbi:hypothetical protein HMI54_001897 [Coelomomyces lativittatus]|nr:hypothetical protein HMI56_006971 [Coelomomyces lativittatus]KAJ1510046.1 hypothetical protein HMI54_001897 [Coelomomyces lativittatus]KAJ1515738.1 hypothetical protein HMI55_003381 [Coelomomyces lativittatus]